MTIYLPDTSSSCNVVLDSNTIRSYSTTPEINSSSDYTDYFINSHYISKSGTENFSDSIPVCMTDNFTTNVFYRNDIDSILLIFFILLLVCFLFPYKIISRIFGRWFKI